jgi:RNA polymerase sigma-70 factor (ECF subfamily)
MAEAAHASISRAELEHLLRVHESRLRAICRSVTSAADDPDDVLQDTWYQIVRNVHQFRGDSSFLTWAGAIARSQANRHRRRRARIRRRETEVHAISESRADFLATKVESPLEGSARGRIRAEISCALRALSPIDRAVFVLRDFEGCTAAEVAEQLGLTVSAVKSRLHRARRTIRGHLAVAA